MRSTYGLDTPRDAPWQERAACGSEGVDPELFFPSTGEGAAAGMALHICWSHCPVRQECAERTEENPPEDPQIIGGRRWVMSRVRGQATQPETWLTPPRSTGCSICREA